MKSYRESGMRRSCVDNRSASNLLVASDLGADLMSSDYIKESI